MGNAPYNRRIALPPNDDAPLIEAAQSGDGRALNDLLTAHYDRWFGICRRLAGNDADALDAAQEALMAVVRGLGSYDGRAAFSTWSYRVVTNACLDELRRRKRRPDPADPVEALGTMTNGTSVADDVALSLDLDAAMDTLSLDFRAPLVLRDLIGLDYAQIAETLDIPPGTVRSRIARGRAALARSLTDTTENSQAPGNQAGTTGRTTGEQHD